MGLQPQKLGSGLQAFFKNQTNETQQEQRQMPAYSRKILGITVAFLAKFVKTKVNQHDTTTLNMATV